jgi:hypothetical protein
MTYESCKISPIIFNRLLLEVSENMAEEPFRILYTGNCRLNLKDLRRLGPLYHDKNGKFPKLLSKVYVDTSYCIPEVNEFPARSKVTSHLIQEIKDSLTMEPDMRFEMIGPG